MWFGAIKLALLFKKRETLNKQVIKLQEKNYNDLLYKNAQYFNDRHNYQLVVLDSAVSTTTVTINGVAKTSRQLSFCFDKIKN